MADNLIAEPFLLKLNQIYFDNTIDNNTKLLLMSADFTALLKKIVNNLNIKSISGYSLSLFIINRYNLDDYHNSFFREFYFKVKKIKKDKHSIVRQQKLEFYYHLIVSVVSRIFDIEVDVDTINAVKNYAELKKNVVNKREDFFRVKIIDNRKVNNIRYIVCTDDDLGEFNLILKDDWAEISNIIFPKLSVNLLSVQIITEQNELQVVCDNSSFLILEPDYIIDVTDISQHSDKNSYYHYFIKRYLKNSDLSESLLIGSIVNTIFDDLLIDNTLDFLPLLEKAIKSRLLNFFKILNDKENFYPDFRNRIQSYFDNLVVIINKLEKGEYSTEPSFIAPDYGIQGRLDLLIENESSTTVMELKSGKSPSNNYSIEIGKRKIIAGAWKEHIYQIAGYNLLIEYAQEIQKFNTCLIYSSDERNPIRISTIDNYTRMQFLLQRNYLVALEFKLKAGDFKILDNLIKLIYSPDFDNVNQFAKRDIKYFYSHFSKNREIVKKWFLKYSEFISKEIFINKYGNDDGVNLGFSSFWLDDLKTKSQNKSVLINLKFDLVESEFNNMHLVFFTDNNEEKSVFRVGDLVIIYPYNSENKSPTKNVIYKGYIKELINNKILVSFRNKKINRSKFLLNDRWNLELDQSDVNTKNQFSAIFELLKLDETAQNILLGISEQNYDNDIYNSDFSLNQSQKVIFNKSINANNFFLIQGPPGTGKTSFMLASLTKHYFDSTNKTILVSAYTNRAVEEIFNSISKVIPIDEIIRIGSKTSGESDAVLLSELSNKMKLRDLFDKLKKIRIVISTISSLYTNYEIFTIKKFDLAIIDEASQILEPQIMGVISKVSKFILIGDENQLPAVTLQDDIDCKIEDEELHMIALFNLNNSYFERMIALSKKNNWHQSYGTLEEQARMHIEIMEFPNTNFYNNSLKAIHSKQFAPQTLFSHNSNSFIEKFLSNYRVAFIDCPIELDSKISRSEAIITNRIIELIDKKSKITKSSIIGVISPFKLQCNNILKEISPNFNEFITVDTVERYQGSQREIIIISMAVNSENLLDRATSSNELLGIDRKLNVAITRAKEHLIMLGNSEILSKSSNYKRFIEYCKSKNSYIKFEEFIN